MTRKKISCLPSRQRGGMQAGVDAGIIRVEILDENEYSVVAVEINVKYHKRSQHKSKMLADMLVELAMTEMDGFHELDELDTADD